MAAESRSITKLDPLIVTRIVGHVILENCLANWLSYTQPEFRYPSAENFLWRLKGGFR